MEDFKYVDIFSTKGFEYLLVILFLILLLFFLRWLNTPARRRPAAAAASGQWEKSSILEWFHLNDQYFYHQGHTWVRPEAGELVKIGIDNFARLLIGSAVKWQLPERGQYLQQGFKAWTAEIDGKLLSFLAPISGEVMQINEKFNQNGQSVTGNEWLMEIRVPKLQSHLKNLLKGKIAYSWMQETIDKLNHLMTRDTRPVLADGGEIRDGFLKEINPDAWHEIVAEFLLTRDITGEDQ